MGNGDLGIGALSLLLKHHETGCHHAAQQAANLLERLADACELEPDIQDLFERACFRLRDDQSGADQA
jgi:hypothetical protein